MRILLLFSWLILLAGCATTMPDMNARWQGAKMSTIIQQWGNPNEKLTTPNGNTLYVYKTTSYRTYRAPTPPVAVNVAGSGRPVITPVAEDAATRIMLTCITRFEVDKAGVVVTASAAGEGCDATPH